LGRKELEEAKQFYVEGDYKTSLEKFQTALWYFEEIQDIKQISFIKTQIIRVEKIIKTGILEKSEEVLVEAAPEPEEIGEEEGNLENLLEKLKKEKILIDTRLEVAFNRVPFMNFIPKDQLAKFFADKPCLFYEKETIRTISAPHMICIMIQLLRIEPDDKILILGAKSGYIVALMSHFLTSGHLYILEANPEVANITLENIIRVGYESKITVLPRDPLEGYEEQSPWDKILITGRIPDVPMNILQQVKEEGVVLAPIGDESGQAFTQIKKKGDKFTSRKWGNVVFGPLETKLADKLSYKKTELPSKSLESMWIEDAFKHVVSIKLEKSEKILVSIQVDQRDATKIPILNSGGFDPNTLLQFKERMKQFTNYANKIFAIRRGDQIYNVESITSEDILPLLHKLGKFIYKTLIPTQAFENIKKLQKAYLGLELDSEFLDIPWELLWDGLDFLCLKFPIGRELSSTQYKTTELFREFPLKILLIGNPSGDLEAAEKEIDIIEQNLNTQIPGKVSIDKLKGKTEEFEILDKLDQQYDIIHFAGHSRFSPGSPEKSAWMVYKGEIQPFEILRSLSPGKKAPILVFSNSCESGLECKPTQLAPYEECIYGFADAFQQLGTPAYIGSLWEIHDEAAAQFATHFYNNLINQETIGESLRKARYYIYNKSEGKDVTWGAFILYGEPRLKIFPQK